MSRQVLMTVALLAIGGLIVFGAMNLVRPAGAQSPANANYAVTAAGNSCVLCDTVSGRTWVMFPKADDPRYAWFPVNRLDSDSDVRKWKINKGIEEKEDRPTPAPTPKSIMPAQR